MVATRGRSYFWLLLVFRTGSLNKGTGLFPLLDHFFKQNSLIPFQILSFYKVCLPLHQGTLWQAHCWASFVLNNCHFLRISVCFPLTTKLKFHTEQQNVKLNLKVKLMNEHVFCIPGLFELRSSSTYRERWRKSRWKSVATSNFHLVRDDDRSGPAD